MTQGWGQIVLGGCWVMSWLRSHRFLPADCVNWLLDHGVSLLEVGKIAGSSVPRSVASVPVADTSRALARVDCLLDLEFNSGVPVIDVQAPMVGMEAVKTVLIPVHAATLKAWIPDVPGTVWGQVVQGSSPRKSAVKQGEQWVKSFLRAHGLQKGATVELASDRKDGDLRTRVVVWVSDLPPVFHRSYTVASHWPHAQIQCFKRWWLRQWSRRQSWWVPQWMP